MKTWRDRYAQLTICPTGQPMKVPAMPAPVAKASCDNVEQHGSEK